MYSNFFCEEKTINKEKIISSLALIDEFYSHTQTTGNLQHITNKMTVIKMEELREAILSFGFKCIIDVISHLDSAISFRFFAYIAANTINGKKGTQTISKPGKALLQRAFISCNNLIFDEAFISLCKNNENDLETAIQWIPVQKNRDTFHQNVLNNIELSRSLHIDQEFLSSMNLKRYFCVENAETIMSHIQDKSSFNLPVAKKNRAPYKKNKVNHSPNSALHPCPLDISSPLLSTPNSVSNESKNYPYINPQSFFSTEQGANASKRNAGESGMGTNIDNQSAKRRKVETRTILDKVDTGIFQGTQVLQNNCPSFKIFYPSINLEKYLLGIEDNDIQFFLEEDTLANPTFD